MAVELEEKVMQEIGLGQNYRWYNGSGSCGYIRQNAVDKLQSVAQDHDLSISPKWLERCKESTLVDNIDGEQYSLTNVWITCSYAIRDAIYRQSGSGGFEPPSLDKDWQFWDKERERVYKMERRSSMRDNYAL